MENDKSMVERVARAIQETTETPYSIQLVELICGIALYELRYDGGEAEDFPSHSAALAEVVSRRSSDQAKASIQAMREPTNQMLEDVGTMEGFDSELKAGFCDEIHSDWWRAMIDAAISGKSGMGEG